MAEIVLDHVSKVYLGEGASAVADLNLRSATGSSSSSSVRPDAGRRRRCGWSPGSSRSPTARSRSAIAS